MTKTQDEDHDYYKKKFAFLNKTINFLFKNELAKAEEVLKNKNMTYLHYIYLFLGLLSSPIKYDLNVGAKFLVSYLLENTDAGEHVITQDFLNNYIWYIDKADKLFNNHLEAMHIEGKYDRKRASQLLTEVAVQYCKNKNTDLRKICFFILHVRDRQQISKIFESIDKDRLSTILPELIDKGLLAANVPLLQHMQTKYYDLFTNYINKQGQSTLLENILNDPHNNFTSKMLSNINQETPEHLGRNGYKEILLTCAQIKSRKKYYFNPIVINQEDDNEFEKLMKLLSSNLDDFKGKELKFILVGNIHCFAGEIRIDKQGGTKIFIMDPINYIVSNEQESRYELYNLDRRELAKVLYLIDMHMPQADIILPRERLQNSSYDCALFAIANVNNLFRVEKYLPHKWHSLMKSIVEKHCPTYFQDALLSIIESYFSSKDLFKYLYSDIKKVPCHILFYDESDQAQEITIEVNATRCPLYLMKAMQSRKLINEIIPKREIYEQKASVNKKGENALQVAEQDFRYHQETGKKINTRMEKIWNKLRLQNLKYLIVNTEEDIICAINQFTLNQYIKNNIQPSAVGNCMQAIQQIQPDNQTVIPTPHN